MRAIGYYRSREAQQRPPHDPVRAFEDYCELNLHQPVATFGGLGLDEDEADAEYRRMTDFMRDSGSEFLVVVRNARHLGADLESVARSLIELVELGATIVCDDEEFPDPLQNAFQTLGVRGVSRTRSKSIKESMRVRASEGRALGRPPYGYRIGPDGRLEPVREETAVVELIYRLYTRDRLGLRLIAQHLNEREIPTRRGGRWNLASIREILKNPSYIGTHTRLGMRLPKAHEAIIPPEVFRAARDIFRSRRPFGRVANAEPFLLSGIAYCAYCGNKMIGVTRRQSWKLKDGRRSRGTYRYYQCQSRNNQSLCKYHTWRAPLLEGLVHSQLRHVLPMPAAEHGSNGPTRAEEIRTMRESRVRIAERRFLRALRRAANGKLGVMALGGYLNDLDSARRGLDGSERTGDVAAVLDQWDVLDLEARQYFLKEHVARVIVKDEAVEVVV